MKQRYSFLIVVFLLSLSSLTASAQTKTKTAKQDSRSYKGPPTKAAITPGDLKTRLFIFADDSMRGRAAGTPDNIRGTNYIEREVKKLGLKPGGENGTYHQDVPVFLRSISQKSSITVGGQTFTLGRDFIPRDNGAGMRSISGATAVYGGVIGDNATMLAPNDAAGKIVILTLPSGWSVNRSAITARYLSAAGIGIATLDAATPEDRAGLMSDTSAILRSDAPAAPRPAFMYISTALANALLRGGALASLASGTLGQSITGDIAYDAVPAPARNVIAILPGSDRKLRGQYVAVGGHNDHLSPSTPAVDHDSIRSFQIVARPGGVESQDRDPTPEEWTRINAMIDSLRRIRPPRLDSIHNGADDDGSGSMAVLEIAEAFAKAKVKPKRSLIFVWHTGEELGLYGSQYFTDHPTVPRDSIVAQLNIDMVGRGGVKDVVWFDAGKPVYGGPTYVQLIGSRRLSTELGNIIDSVNAKQRIPLDIDYRLDANGEPHQYYCRSDHYNYARYGIPIAFFFDGGHADYHEVTDEPQYIDYPHYARIVNMVRDAVETVANLDHRVVVDKAKPAVGGRCVQ
jgi:hypothetical protein